AHSPIFRGRAVTLSRFSLHFHSVAEDIFMPCLHSGPAASISQQNPPYSGHNRPRTAEDASWRGACTRSGRRKAPAGSRRCIPALLGRNRRKVMNMVITRQYEMLARVREFGTNHSELFPTGTRAAAVLATIAAA